jgi:hypothetical protein
MFSLQSVVLRCGLSDFTGIGALRTIEARL